MAEGSFTPENLGRSPTDRSVSNKETAIEGRKFVEVNGTRVSYIERGNPHGIALMYIGGWASSASGDRWFLDALEGKIPNSKGLQALSEYNREHPEERQSAEGIKRMVESLKNKYRIVDLELPGFGKSSPLEGKINLDRMADFTVEFQEAVGLEKPVIFGSSMGGIVAVKLAARHPEAVKALFLQGLMSKPEDMDKKAYTAAQIATKRPVTSWVIRPTLRIPGVAPKVFALLAKGSKDFKMSEKEAQDAMIEGARLAHPRTAISTLAEIGSDIGNDIEQVQCPVVVIDGASGDMVPILNSADVAGRFHPNIKSTDPQKRSDYEEKIAQKKMAFLPIGGKSEEQSHTIVNTLPEGTAVMIDDVLGKLFPEQKLQA